MLASVRTAYLNVDARSVPHGRSGLGSASRTIDLTGDGAQSSWSNVKYLTNEERDQIDLQARVILTRCADRVKEMEALEKRACTLTPQALDLLYIT
jgi:syntaxin 18